METAEFLPLTACWLTIALKFSFPGWRFIPKPRPRRTSVSFGPSVNLSRAPLDMEADGCWDASCMLDALLSYVVGAIVLFLFVIWEYNRVEWFGKKHS